MDDKKICFIMCTNDQVYSNEAIYFINKLKVPQNYSVEVLTVSDATCMTAGYNEAMEASDAKYKVYLHQDVFIVETYFIYKLLDMFKNPEIGMIGMVGAPKLPDNKIMWNGPRIGKIYTNNIYGTRKWELGLVKDSYQQVEAIDGLLMATQYDIRWREDIFDKWDFYDVSQSLEFRKAGYKVVVPSMVEPWCIHDDGFMDLSNYYNQRRLLLNEY